MHASQCGMRNLLHKPRKFFSCLKFAFLPVLIEKNEEFCPDKEVGTRCAELLINSRTSLLMQ
jgi:hypothetical protein